MAGLGSIWWVGGVGGVGGGEGGGVVKVAKAPHLHSSLWHPGTLKRPSQAGPNPLGSVSNGRRTGGTLTLTPVSTLISLHPPPSSPPTHPPPAPLNPLQTGTKQPSPPTLSAPRPARVMVGREQPATSLGVVLDSRYRRAASAGVVMAQQGLQGGGERVVVEEGQTAPHRAKTRLTSVGSGVPSTVPRGTSARVGGWAVGVLILLVGALQGGVGVGSELTLDSPLQRHPAPNRRCRPGP